MFMQVTFIDLGLQWRTPANRPANLEKIHLYTSNVSGVPSGNQTWQWKIPYEWKF